MTKQELEALKQIVASLNNEEKVEISKVLADDLLKDSNLSISKTPKLMALLLVARQQLSKKETKEKITRIVDRFKDFSYNQQEYIINTLIDNADNLTGLVARNKAKSKTKTKDN